MSGTVDDKYYQVVKPAGLAERLLIAAREKIYADFLAQMQPSPKSRIADIGISDVVSDGANVLERNYPHLQNVTACGLGSAENFQRAFPAVHYRQIEPNAPLPFEDNAFDIATANAVLEHVGSVANQRTFLRELTRIARRVFVSVPHRYFPVEHHTAIPLLHFSDRTFKTACALLRKSSWAEETNLILMTRGKLAHLATEVALGAEATIGTTGLNLGPFSSNLYLALKKKV
jgi:hypothetical protein